MESLSLGLKILASISLIMLILGLYKPWIVLWWEDKQYRLKVIQIYGSVAILTWLASKLVHFLVDSSI